MVAVSHLLKVMSICASWRCGLLSIIWKSDLFDKIKQDFFQAAVVSILLCGCTTWTPTKHIEKKLDMICTRTLRAILNNYWKQQLTKQQLYSYLSPISKPIQVRQTRHAKHCWRSKDELISDVLLWTPSHGHASVVDQQELTYTSSVWIEDVIWKTCWERWMIGTDRERERERESQGNPC